MNAPSETDTNTETEARPRFGLMRSREFIMKDAHPFDRDQAGRDKSYDEMYAAYEKIFDQMWTGLQTGGGWTREP